MLKINAYHRPQTVDEALRLLTRPNVSSVVIAGGTYLTPRLPEDADAVVDLQALGLTGISAGAGRASLGAMTTLQAVVDHPDLPPLLRDAARREGPNTFRQAGTVGGAIAAPSQESEFVAALLVLEAQVTVQNLAGSQTIALSELLADMPTALGGGIITTVSLTTGGATAAERVARTPADTPIVAALARRDTAGSIRLALVGVAATPILVDPVTDVKAAVNPPADFRGSTEYRRQMAATLAKRVINELEM